MRKTALKVSNHDPEKGVIWQEIRQNLTVWHSSSKLQKPAINSILKIREIDGSYMRLQRFDKFCMWTAGNRKRKLCEFAETSMEKLVKSHQHCLDDTT